MNVDLLKSEDKEPTYEKCGVLAPRWVARDPEHLTPALIWHIEKSPSTQELDKN